MRAEVYWVKNEEPGRVGIVPRPRGNDWLEDEVSAWRLSGIDVVVSLLTSAEVEEFGLQAEEAECNKCGIRFLSFPVQDRGIPLSRDAAVALADDLAGEIARGRSVVVHCRQSIGRSALMASMVLARMGQKPGRALLAVQDARGRPVPDTEEQRAWVLAAGKDGAISVSGVRESEKDR